MAKKRPTTPVNTNAETGEKEAPMVTETATAAQPATTPATVAAPVEIDYDKLADSLAKKQAAAKQAESKPAETGPKPITIDDLHKVLNDRDTKASLAADKAAYIAAKMKDLPDVYHALLGDDKAQWPAKEQEIRTKVRADLKALGVSVPDLGGEGADGTTVLDPKAAVDLTKMTPSQRISLGLKQSKPARAPSTLNTGRARAAR